MRNNLRQPHPYILFFFVILVLPITGGSFSQPAAQTDSIPALDPAELNGLPVGNIWCTGNNRTRDRILIQELLIQTGDPFDLELIEESERNLREFSYLGSAEIIPHLDESRGVIDLEVQVSDRFPYIIFPAPSFGGGRFDMDFVIAHMNLLGRGQQLGLQGRVSSDEADTYIGWFVEPRLAGSRWKGAVVGGRQGERGEQFGLEISRPLFALSTKWAFELSAFDWESEQRLYDSGFQISQYYRRQRGGSFALTRSFRRDDRRLEASLSYRYFEEDNEQDQSWTGPISADKQRGIVKAELSAEQFRFIEDTYLFQMGPVEDIKLGPRVTLRLGGALEVLGSDRNYPEFGMSLSWFGGSPDRGYLELSLWTDTRIEKERITNNTGGGSLGGYFHLGRTDLLSLRSRGSFQRRMENPSQFLLGSGRGLRGYKSQAFDGDRLLVSTAEWRHMLWERNSWALASAAFTDAGTIWDNNQSIGDVPFLFGAGIGIRMSFPGLIGGPILRLDVGYGFKDEYVDISFGV
jgi:outer membrane protein assembly factor BamA